MKQIIEMRSFEKPVIRKINQRKNQIEFINSEIRHYKSLLRDYRVYASDPTLKRIIDVIESQLKKLHQMKKDLEHKAENK